MQVIYSRLISTKDDLKRFFERFGGVQDAIVLRDVRTNVSRGFGFITFDSEEAADRCVKENNCEIKEKKVDVKRAEPRQINMRQSRTYPIPPPDMGSAPSEDPAKYYPQYPQYYPPYPYPYPYGAQAPEGYPPMPTPGAEAGKMYPGPPQWNYPHVGMYMPPEQAEGKMRATGEGKAKEGEGKDRGEEKRGRSRSKGSVSSKGILRNCGKVNNRRLCRTHKGLQRQGQNIRALLTGTTILTNLSTKQVKLS